MSLGEMMKEATQNVMKNYQVNFMECNSAAVQH